MQGDLTQWSIIALLLLMQVVHSAIALTHAGGHRWPYSALLAAVALYFLAAVSQIIVIVVGANVASRPNLTALAAFNALATYFVDYSVAFLFLAVALMLFNRLAMIRHSSRGKAGKISGAYEKSCYGLFGILMFLATITASLYADFLASVYSPNFSNIAQLMQRTNARTTVAM